MKILIFMIITALVINYLPVIIKTNSIAEKGGYDVLIISNNYTESISNGTCKEHLLYRNYSKSSIQVIGLDSKPVQCKYRYETFKKDYDYFNN